MRPRFAYVGCFTTEKRKARGNGIAVFRIDPDNGAWQRVEARNKETAALLDRLGLAEYFAVEAYVVEPADPAGTARSGSNRSPRSAIATSPGAGAKRCP